MQLFELFATIGLKDEGFHSGIEKAKGAFGTINSAADSVVSGMIKFGAVIGTALLGVGTAAIKMGMDFESQMSKVGAISGASAEDMTILGDKAKEMGAKTKFSATESGQAFEYMAMAGWKTNEMLDGIEGIMNLAAASGESLALTSDIVTDALTAMGLKASDSAHFADVLAAASSNANTNVAMMGETFKYAAPVAGALGYSIEDTAVAIGLMANSGIKASMAGTSLRRILTELAGGAIEVKGGFGKATIETQNLDGTMRPLSDVLVDLRGAFSNLTEAERAATAESIAGKVGMSGFLALVNAAPEDFEKLTNAVANADGEAQRMTDTMLDNLGGAITILKSQLEGLGIQFYESVDIPLRNIVSSAQGYVSQLSEAFSAGGLAGMVAQLGDIFSDIVVKISEQAPKMINVVVNLVDNLVTGLVANSDKILNGAMTAFTAILDGLKTVLPKLVPLAVDGIKAFIAGFIAYKEMIFTTGIEIFTALVQGLADAIPDLVPMAINAIMNIVDTLISNLPLLVTAGMQIIAEVLNGIAAALPELVPKIVEVVLSITQAFFDNLPLVVESGLAILMGLIEGIINAIPILVDELPKIINSIVEFLMQSIPAIIDAGIKLFISLIEALPQIIELIVVALPQIITAIIATLMMLIPQIIEAGIKLLVALVQNIPAIITGLIAALPQIIQGLIDGIISHLPEIIMAGVQLLVALVENTPAIIMGLIKAIPKIILGLVDAIIKFVPKMAETGLNLIKGLWEGISDAAEWLWGKVSGFFSQLTNKIKNFFGIASPSKLFAWFGEMNMEGFGKGFLDGAGDVLDTVSGIMGDIADTIGGGSDFKISPVMDKIPSLSNMMLPLTQDGALSGATGGNVFHIAFNNEFNVTSDTDVTLISQRLADQTLSAMRLRGGIA